MRRAGQKRIVSLHTTPATPPAAIPRGGSVVELEFSDAVTLDDSPSAESPNSGDVTRRGLESDARTERQRHLEIAIRQRIETRLPGRIRNLGVRTVADKVVLEGQCATYYTKQLAQHAALGVLEEEHLENAIVVNVAQ